MGIISKRVNCAICEGKELKEVLDLGYVPLAGYFPEVDQSLQPERYPLKLLICEDCKLAQVDNIILQSSWTKGHYWKYYSRGRYTIYKRWIEA